MLTVACSHVPAQKEGKVHFAGLVNPELTSSLRHGDD